MEKWSRPRFSITIIVSSLFCFFCISIPQANSQPPSPENFLRCLDKQPSDAGRPNSAAAVVPTNSTFPTMLLNYVRNLRFASPTTRKPEAIVAAESETQIRAVIACCKAMDLELRIRSGGHDYEGFSYVSPVPFVVLDMYNFRRIDIDMETDSAWIQAGATLGELYYNIADKSEVRGFPAGVCPKVGAGGHFSGGGFGNMMRKYGLSVDHIVDAKIMDANGKIYDRRSMGEDVFWAIRGGGGGSYGVILAWKIMLVPVPEKVTVFKLEKTVGNGAVDLVWKWQFIAPRIDRDLFIRLEIKPVNRNRTGGKTIKVSFIGMFLGLPDRLMSITNRSFPELGLKKSDCMVMKWVRSALFWANYPLAAPSSILLKRVSTNEYYWKRTSDFVNRPISKPGLVNIFKKMIDLSPFPRRVWMQWNPYGGKMSEIPSDSTPFVHRSGEIFMIEHFMNWYEPGEGLAEKFIGISRRFREEMAPYVSKNPREAFFNYRDVDIGTTMTGANSNSTYGAAKVYGVKYFKGNFERLVKVKTRFDPENFFRSQQGIPVLS
ncbi:PREDICTED: berberine bridge enzyme-like 4 [Tarenaya hassleriana]|uniref:berberine bridge enzyme-like 4 n=1 Tax=Tarenaya hassleriana TaxID=28532 RepID=UPI00053C2CDA|nr:PREDICTED: berberine bridge enzyme-like 4 [Tarenaya hassleriana]